MELSSGIKEVLSTSPLNEYVLRNLFEYLPLRDRLNAKLICKTWFQAASLDNFLKREKFYFPHFYDFRSIMEELANVQRPFWNLKFDHRDFHPDFQLLLEKFGSRIRSLELHQCKFYEETLPLIFTHCINLEEFYLTGDCRIHTEPELQSSDFVRRKSIFQTEVNLLQEKLTTFHINCTKLSLHDCDLSFIASTCLYLKSLRFHLKSKQPVLPSSVLRNLQRDLIHLESLELYFRLCRVNAVFVQYYGLNYFELSRLKQVGMTLYLNEEILNSISRYKFWTTICIDWAPAHFSAYPNMTLIPRVLVEFPSLKNLEFLWWPPTSASDFCRLFVSLVKSNLISLHIRMPLNSEKFRCGDSMNSILNRLNLTCNRSVRKLHVTGTSLEKFGRYGFEIPVLSLFVAYFRNVQDLRLASGNPNFILSKQTSLKKLTLDYTIFLPSDRKKARGTLKPQAECLEVMELWSDADLYFHYQFPNLKFLCVTDDESEFGVGGRCDKCGFIKNLEDYYKSDSELFCRRIHEVIHPLYEKCSQLEFIEFRCRTAFLHMNALVSFLQKCQKFHQLRYLILKYRSFSGRNDDIEQAFTEFSHQCPSIRCVWFKNRRSHNVLHFNKITTRFQYYDQCPDYFSGDADYDLHSKYLQRVYDNINR